MPQNTGKGFEELTQRVFQSLHRQQFAKNVRVERDISLTGFSGVARQIDVYWEFELAGITHRVLVECKDWTKPVDLDVVSALLGKLSDLPGHVGAIVARRGFQEGARSLAEAHHIVLYELRAPTDDDWTGFITTVNITGRLFMPKVLEISFLWDLEWNANERDRLGLAEQSVALNLHGEEPLQREDGSELITLNDVLNEHLLPGALGPPEWLEYIFQEPAYVETGQSGLPRLRARGVKMKVELVLAMTELIEVKLGAFVGLILKEVTKGTFSVLDADGQPLEPGHPKPARIIRGDGGGGVGH